MSVADLEMLLANAVHDSEFRKTLLSNPRAALKSKGLDPTDERVAALKALKYTELQNLAKAFGHPEAGDIQ